MRVEYEEIKCCRVCGSKELTSVLSLGEQYFSDFLDQKDSFNGNNKTPLELVICQNKNCRLLQTKHTVSRSVLFTENYWFRSSVNESLIEGLFDISKSDERKLDVYEDFPILYKKMYFKYYGKKVMTYTMVKKTPFRYPTERYLNIVKRGYKDCNLDKKYLKKALMPSW